GEHVRHGIGDVQRVAGPGGPALFEMDAAAPADGEPVDDVPRAAPVELVVRPRDPHPDPGTGEGVLDRSGDLRHGPGTGWNGPEGLRGIRPRRWAAPGGERVEIALRRPGLVLPAGRAGRGRHPAGGKGLP